VIVVCQETLHPLVASCPGIDRLLGQNVPLPDFDVHAPLLSLPGILGTNLTNIPADIPYLAADAERGASWRRELGAIRELKIGIAWKGSPGYYRDHHRSLQLAQLAPLATLAGVRLFSLQKGPGAEQLKDDGGSLEAADLGSHFKTFGDTAAAIVKLDLVISADTAVAHCAGALGVPVWVLQPFAPDWRWLLHREDTPWYPGMRLFRQPRTGAWDKVIERIVLELRDVLRARNFEPEA